MRRNPELRMAIWDCFRIPGELDTAALTDSIEILVTRHEALRTEVFERPDGQPVQRIRDLPPRADLIRCQHVRARSEEQFGRYVRHVMVQQRRQKWDADAYPFTFRLLRYSPTVHALVAGFSHMAIDGVGADLLGRDLMRTYADARAGRAPRGLPRRRFTESIARPPGGDGPGRAAAAPGPPHSLTRFELPPPGPAERDRRSRLSSLSLAGTRLFLLRAQADLHGCTEFTWILAAFARTVLAITSQEQITIAVPINLRGPAERDVVGMFVVEVPVVVDRPRGAGAERGFVAAVGGAVLRAMVRSRRGGAGAESQPINLSVNYRKTSSSSSSAFSRLAATDYLPRVDYRMSGMGLRILSYPDALDIEAAFDTGVFSADDARDASETLVRNLTSVADR